MLHVDDRIESTSFLLGEWPLSRVFLKNDQNYPWFVLVPRKENIQEIFQLTKEERSILMEEINQLSVLMRDYFQPQKLNVGAIGNIVSQLHVHVVARWQQDALWPQSIWQSAQNSQPYELEGLDTFVATWCKKIVEVAPLLGK